MERLDARGPNPPPRRRFRCPAAVGRAGLLAAWLACAGCAASLPGHGVPAAGTYEQSLRAPDTGARRDYRLHVPRGYDGARAVPLVVAIHGAFSDAAELERQSDFSRIADREGFVVAYPEGTSILGFLSHWNSGHCCAKALGENIDDVGFIGAVIADVATRLRIDPERIYVVGHSNGGMLAHRIAADGRVPIAAAAAVAATVGGRAGPDQPEWVIPTPPRPVPILIMHGRADEHVPYDGGRGRRSRGANTALPVSRSVDTWLRHDGCDAAAETRALQAHVTQQTWNRCANGAQVVLVTLDTWAHGLPGPELIDAAGGDPSLRGFSAAEVIWDFLRRHRRTERAGG